MKIKINIPGFSERYCSNDVKYELYNNEYGYVFYKKGTYIVHNEYGPALEYKDKSYAYFINGKAHRLGDFVIYDKKYNYETSYHVINKYLGETKEEFIKNLANVLIPKEYE